MGFAQQDENHTPGCGADLSFLAMLLRMIRVSEDPNQTFSPPRYDMSELNG